MFASRPEIAIEIERLSPLLRDVPIAETVTYADLSEAIGYDVQERPFSLIRARKAVEAETGMRFDTIRGVGIKKLPAEAVIGIGAHARKRISRVARRQSERLTGLRYNDITPETRQRIEAERSMLGAISAISNAPVKTIEAHTATKPISADQLFSLIARK